MYISNIKGIYTHSMQYIRFIALWLPLKYGWLQWKYVYVIPPLHNSTTSICIRTTVYIGVYARYTECRGGIMDLYHDKDSSKLTWRQRAREKLTWWTSIK